MTVKKYGLRDTDEIRLHTYAEAARLDGFTIHAGDSRGVLKGTRLDQVMNWEARGPNSNRQRSPARISRTN